MLKISLCQEDLSQFRLDHCINDKGAARKREREGERVRQRKREGETERERGRDRMCE